MPWRYFKKKRAGAIFLTAAVFLVSGCVVERRYSSGVTSNRLDLTAPLLMPEGRQKLPISVGLYYSPEFANHQQQWSWDVPLGAASLRLFDQASHSLFAKVIPVSSRPPLGENLAIDGVIEPQIEAFEINDLASLGFAEKLPVRSDFGFEVTYPYLARIRYRFVLYDPSGASITSWVVIGDAAMLMANTTVDYFALLIDAALQDAMRQFVQGFALNPEVIQWLARKKTQ